LLVGLAESASVTLVGAEFRTAAAFIVLILVLMMKPNGLFGERT
jgi:branched-chain amino acid transport system permease protein